MTAAKWLFEAGHIDAGLRDLPAAVHETQQLVSGPIRRADRGDHSEQLPGAVNPKSSPDPASGVDSADPDPPSR